MEESNNEHTYIFVENNVQYCGSFSKKIACLFCFICFPIVPFVYCCPCDEKKVKVLRNIKSLDDINDEEILKDTTNMFTVL